MAAWTTVLYDDVKGDYNIILKQKDKGLGPEWAQAMSAKKQKKTHM